MRVTRFLITVLVPVLLCVGLALGETGTANITGTLYADTPIGVTKVSDLSFSAFVNSSGEDVDFSTKGSYTPAQFEVTGAKGATVTIVVQTTGSRTGSVDVVEANTGYHFDLTVTCRVSGDSMPASTTDGVDCADGIAIPDSGKVYVAVFPAVLQNTTSSAHDPLPGDYSGTVTIEVNYE